jgi:hypothetical protein
VNVQLDSGSVSRIVKTIGTISSKLLVARWMHLSLEDEWRRKRRMMASNILAGELKLLKKSLEICDFGKSVKL